MSNPENPNQTTLAADLSAVAVDETVALANGTYTGSVVSLEVRRENIVEKSGPNVGKVKPVAYLDIGVRETASSVELTYGLPMRLAADGTTVSIGTQSDLAKFLLLFGHKVGAGQPTDLEGILLNKPVAFVVQRQPGRNGGEFATIVKGSLRPAA